MAIEIVDFPIKNGDVIHSYVTNYQRVCQPIRSEKSNPWGQLWVIDCASKMQVTFTLGGQAPGGPRAG